MVMYGNVQGRDFLTIIKKFYAIGNSYAGKLDLFLPRYEILSA